MQKGEVDVAPGEIVESKPPLMHQSQQLEKAEKPSARARLDFDEVGVDPPIISLRLKREDDLPYVEDGDDDAEEDSVDDDNTDAKRQSSVLRAAGEGSDEESSLEAKKSAEGVLPGRRRVTIRRNTHRNSTEGGSEEPTDDSIDLTTVPGYNASTSTIFGLGVDKSKLRPSRRGGQRRPRTEAKDLRVSLRQALALLKALLDKEGDMLCDAFLELPSRRTYPDYYKVIATPVSLEEIMSSIEDGTYETARGFVGDLQRMVTNAQFYNEDGSDVWNAADAIRRHIEHVTIPRLAADGFPVEGPTKDSASASPVQSAGDQESARLKVRLSSRGAATSTSPVVDSKDRFDTKAAKSPSQTPSVPPSLVQIAQQNQSHTGTGAERTVSNISDSSRASTGQTPSSASQTEPPLTSNASTRPMAAAPSTVAQQARPQASLPQQSTSQQVRPSYPASAHGRPPQPSMHVPSRPPGVSPMPAQSQSPLLHPHQGQQARPPFSARPHVSPSPAPGGAGMAGQHFQGRPPSFAPRGPERPSPQPFSSGAPMSNAPPPPPTQARPSWRLPGDGPLDPLSALCMETDSGKTISRKPVSGSFVIKARASDSETHDIVLRNDTTRVHSVHLDIPREEALASKPPVEIGFRLRDVIQRDGGHVELFRAAPDWKVQVLFNGRGLDRLSHRISNEASAKRPNGVASPGAEPGEERAKKKDNKNAADVSSDGDGDGEGNASDEDDEESDDERVGGASSSSSSSSSKAGTTMQTRRATGAGGVFEVPPSATCIFGLRPSRGTSVIDIAIAPPPPDAGLHVLAMDNNSGVSEAVRMQARALLAVPERYRIFLQCQ